VLRWDEAVAGEDERAVRFAVTDRTGGTSAQPYASLNLGGAVGDDPQAVAGNRARVAAAIGLAPDRLLFARQVHGAGVLRVDGPWAGSQPPEADALVTREPGLALAVLVADCTPVLLADPRAGVVGVAHAGRRGLVAGVVPALVAALRELGAETILARVGPSICGRCYEVPVAMRAEVAAVAPEACAVSRHGNPALDVAAGVVAQLAPHCWDLEWLDGCSVESADLYSYRRDRVTGRYAGIAWSSP
jgi:polyphenol oxidase